MKTVEEKVAALSPSQRALLLERLRERRLPVSWAVPGTTPAGPSSEQGARDGQRGPHRALKLSLCFFSDTGSAPGEPLYRILLESAQFADRNGLWAVWLPERHFHEFGGPYPNPSVLASALAVLTRRIHLRAGSIVLPLHNPIRVAEEWSVVDHLSGGRVGLSFASGWHPTDFVLATSPYAERKETMFRGIQTVERLWRGEELEAEGSGATRARIQLFPRPLQRQLPIWVTSSNSLDTWLAAARIGANVLTGLMEQSVEELAEKIARYRRGLLEHGYAPGARSVTVMLHTYVGRELASTRETVRGPLGEYLANHMRLYERFARTSNPDIRIEELTGRDRQALVELGLTRYLERSALLGTPETCAAMARSLQAIGVDELSCLVNFGLPFQVVMEGLERLVEVRDLLDLPPRPADATATTGS